MPERSSSANQGPDRKPGGVGGNEETASLGRRIRDLRKTSRMSLEQASVATGLSRAAISKIERGEMSPTYDSLCKLASGFDVDLARLISGRPQGLGEVDVTRARAGPRQRTERFVHRLLAPEFAQRAMYVFETQVLATRLEDYEQWDRHDSEDFLYVLQGALMVHMEGRDPVELHAGDGLQMDGRIPHALLAVATKGRKARDAATARVLWISVPLNR